jgi:hypothetical protein
LLTSSRRLSSGRLASGECLSSIGLSLRSRQRNGILACGYGRSGRLIRGDLRSGSLRSGLRGSRLGSYLGGPCRCRSRRLGGLAGGSFCGAGLRGGLYGSGLRRHCLRRSCLGRVLRWRGLSRLGHRQGQRSEESNHKEGLESSSEHVLDPLFRVNSTSNRMLPLRGPVRTGIPIRGI